MTLGRLIRVRKDRNDIGAALYVVAIAECDNAVAMLQESLLRPSDEYEDLGCVNETLLTALKLKPGQFSRI
jgi:hypothetical protein